MTKEKPDAESLEASMKRLEAIVTELESGDQPLEAALSRFEEGLDIGRRCRDILDHAEERVRRLVDVDAEGSALTDDADEAR
jgi:exodeoxyribonuclease VII small subunit